MNINFKDYLALRYVSDKDISPEYAVEEINKKFYRVEEVSVDEIIDTNGPDFDGVFKTDKLYKFTGHCSIDRQFISYYVDYRKIGYKFTLSFYINGKKINVKGDCVKRLISLIQTSEDDSDNDRTIDLLKEESEMDLTVYFRLIDLDRFNDLRHKYFLLSKEDLMS